MVRNSERKIEKIKKVIAKFNDKIAKRNPNKSKKGIEILQHRLQLTLQELQGEQEET